jgi:hypothetical protein
MVMVLIAALSAFPRRGASSPVIRYGPVSGPFSDPFVGDGTRVSLATAKVMGIVPMYLAQTALANDGSTVSVWVRTDPSIPEVFIYYASGLSLSIRPYDPGLGDPVSFYQALEQGGPPPDVGIP